MSTEKVASLNFLEQIIEEDIKNGKHGGRIHTRFPPEPNGYLHIGHAKSICLNFGLAIKYGGKTNLRFDDTNPTKEEVEYVDSIKEDIKWLGFDWEGEALFASDYFDQLYEFAVLLIKKGLAFVDDSSQEEISRMRGVPTQPGEESPYRNRSIEENLDLFARMKAGEFDEGSRVLRAKIDMTSPNMHMRDPIMYRILKAHHHRTGDKWCIYPMYDFAHGQSDSIEKITHSICTLEFENHRPLYNWFIEKLEIFPSRQIEFARLNLAYTVMSKRKLMQLVKEKYVSGWDDPRMPTISGLRRRGYTPQSIRSFADTIGITRRKGITDLALLENSIRTDLNKRAPRVFGVLDPLKIIITNYPEGQVEDMPAINNPEDETMGTRTMPFSREVYIERKDFREVPNRKYYGLGPDRNVRLKNGYILHCVDYKKDADGNVQEVYCTYYPNSRSGSDTSGVKCKGTLHWVSVSHAIDAEVRLYDRLFTVEAPGKEEDFKAFLNPDSLTVLTHAKLEPSLKTAKVGDRFQFMRMGYFIVDKDTNDDKLVFNRTVTLKDTWAKKQKKQQ